MSVISMENKKIVEVFKTNIESFVKAELLLQELKKLLLHAKINFDLDDCDHILRIEALHSEIDVGEVIDYVKNIGVEIEVLL